MAGFIDIFSTNYLLIISFFAIAILYSSVGFGGGSSYLALLSLTLISFHEYRIIALICNIIVVSGGTYLYYKNKLIDWKKVIPLVLFSVPMAFLGGYLEINNHLFLILLGSVLIIASLLMFFVKNETFSQKKSKKEQKIHKNVIVGGIIGFISGLVGIGGGIFLSPVLNLSKWDSVKKIAATSSFFILVNSISGLIGQVQNPAFKIDVNLTITLAIIVLIGGQIGSRISIKILNPTFIRTLTAILVGFVGIKILFS